jgi:hypothetical protein
MVPEVTNGRSQAFSGNPRVELTSRPSIQISLHARFLSPPREESVSKLADEQWHWDK